MSPRHSGDRRRSTCKICGLHRQEGARVSRSGLCEKCAIARLIGAQEALQTKEGPVYDRWAAGMERAAMKRARKRAQQLKSPPDPDQV